MSRRLTPPTTRIGTAIRDRRTATDPPMRQEEAARLAGVSQRTLSGWETGYRIPEGARQLQGLARLLRWKLDKVIATVEADRVDRANGGHVYATP